jgi:hypothetical protein
MLIFKEQYLDSISSLFIELSRSTFFISLIANLLLLGLLSACGFLYGRWKIASLFNEAIRGNEVAIICVYRGRELYIKDSQLTVNIKEKSGYTVIPFPVDIRHAQKHTEFFYKKRCIIIPPPNKDTIWSIFKNEDIETRNFKRDNRKQNIFMGTITILSIVLALGTLKDYYLLEMGFTESPLMNVIFDLFLILASFIFGVRLGKKYFKRCFTYDSSGIKAKIISKCLCVQKYAGRYFIVCPVERLGDFSGEEAERVYNTYQEVKYNKDQVSKWSQFL